MKKLGVETLWGGLFGLIAIMAALVEMALGGFEPSSMVGAVKDVAGTMVAVMVFLIAAKSLLPKKVEGFAGIFELEMGKVENKYSPLLRKAMADGDEKREKKLAGVMRYELSTSMDALIDGVAKNYATFCEFSIDEPKGISFWINKTTFMGRSTESFDTMKDALSSKMMLCLSRKFPDLSDKVLKSANGFDVRFDRTLAGREDAILLAELVDCVTLLYIAECKK